MADNRKVKKAEAAEAAPAVVKGGNPDKCGNCKDKFGTGVCVVCVIYKNKG